jgi:putative transposase
MSEQNIFRYFNSSPEVIRVAVMMYIRHSLSLREVEDLFFERGIDITYETVRFWWHRFGQIFAADLRKKRARAGYNRHWQWHLDEVFVKVNGERHYLWRAIDHEGEVLECYVSKKRDAKKALKFIKKALKRHGLPKRIVTDKLASYRAALKKIGILGRHCTDQYLNNQAENSHLPFRRRERGMLKFRRTKTLQKFVSIHSSIYNHFNTCRHRLSRQNYKAKRADLLYEWRNLGIA